MSHVLLALRRAVCPPDHPLAPEKYTSLKLVELQFPDADETSRRQMEADWANLAPIWFPSLYSRGIINTRSSPPPPPPPPHAPLVSSSFRRISGAAFSPCKRAITASLRSNHPFAGFSASEHTDAGQDALACTSFAVDVIELGLEPDALGFCCLAQKRALRIMAARLRGQSPVKPGVLHEAAVAEPAQVVLRPLDSHLILGDESLHLLRRDIVDMHVVLWDASSVVKLPSGFLERPIVLVLCLLPSISDERFAGDLTYKRINPEQTQDVDVADRRGVLM
ncbi:hypothetical protein WOLCODRAFT_156585 [Wolfiporia cocos MD-104 SS10]|uniref:Uncharacterized protein n=1 Tax=Wolfiporia cocos (strain MD-104) TaxID=742152 RepID=A0A2H3JIR4_WOLCO|nr:hypothetical protein WOLCODRAFT_156585 [Wolfiporia cocos MD-104 SS10]